MDWFKIVSDYYKAGYYDNLKVKTFVVKGKITAAQYEEITGAIYE